MGKSIATSFGIVIPDAFGFRSMIEFLNNIGYRIVTLVVTPDNVYFSERNSDKKIDVDVEIDLLRVNFYYNSEVKNCKMSFDTKKIAEELKTATVKTTLQITKEAGEDSLIFSIYGVNISGDPTNTVVIRPIERTTVRKKWKTDELECDELNSNVYVSAMDFGKMCTVYKEKKTKRTKKMQSVTVSGSTYGFNFSTISSNGEPRIVTRGSYDKEEEIIHYTIPQTTIQTFSGISKFNKSNGIVNMYFEHDKPLKILVPVSNFGIMRLYLENYDENE